MQWIKISLQNVRPIDFMKNTDIFLLGNFNIDLDDKNSPCMKELLFSTAALGLKQQIKEPTRISFRNGVSAKTRIDLIFTNSDLILQALDLNLL